MDETSALPMHGGEYPDYGGTYDYAPDSEIDASLGTDW